jgi:phosphoglycolate phosphatase
MKEILLFDLDGTLTESGPGLINAAVYTFEKLGIEIESREELRRFIGPPLHWSFMTYYNMTREEADNACVIFREYYDKKGVFENSVYDGVYETLEELKKQGYTMMIATAKPEVLANLVLEHFDLMKYFTFVGGANFDENRYNKVEVLQYMVEKLQFPDKSKVLMIGDRYHDVEGAHAVGIECAAILYGYGSLEELEKAGADYICPTPQDILDILN